MPEERSNRRLAAVLAADVVGYSRMMGADEAGTLAALKRHRETLFNPAVAEHNGRVVKLIGDGTLVEFSSVVDAVKCALAIQRSVSAEAGSNGPSITLRIGINLGDVIIDDDDIYGDGVNIAARLEPLAEPGGVCVASIVSESVGQRIDAVFRDGGEVSVKNIDRPVRVWKWHPNDAAPALPQPATAASTGEAKAVQAVLPGIAVLPFDNMSGDPEQEYFSDGISEDIITDLSKVGGLSVIARNSSFAYKGKSPDIRTVGRELGVSSVLEGSIRRAGNRVRINAQLIDAATGAHLWAERYDREIADIFDLQDEITRKIVDALRVTLTSSELARVNDTPTKSVEAHDLFLRARELMAGAVKNQMMFNDASTLLNQAMAVDTDYAEPHAALAILLALDYHNAWTGHPDESLKRAMAHANRAIEMAPEDPFGHYAASVVASFLKDFDRSSREIENALALSPNHAPTINAKGVLLLYSGKADEAIPLIERAMRLDPGYSQQYLHFLGLAYLLSGRLETAIIHFRERILLVPETDFTRVWLASALGQLGEIKEAKRIWAELMEINPSYRLNEHIDRLPFRRREDVDMLVAGLAEAGLPR